MQNIARGSKQNIHLSVYNNGVLIQTDSVPTISLYNADTDAVIASNRSTTLDTESGTYYFYLSEEFTNIVRTIKAVWSYSVSGRAGYEDQYYNVELVYLRLQLFSTLLNFFQLFYLSMHYLKNYIFVNYSSKYVK